MDNAVKQIFASKKFAYLLQSFMRVGKKLLKEEQRTSILISLKYAGKKRQPDR